MNDLNEFMMEVEMVELLQHADDIQSHPSLEALQTRSQDLLGRQIHFVPNPSFEARDCGVASDVYSEINSTTREQLGPVDLPPHLKSMCEADLLTHEQESALFREMNYAKFLAVQLRRKLDGNAPSQAMITEIENHLRRAELIRDHLIKANTRLVISIVKKFVTPQRSFDEMLSDGIMILMQTVDKFDFDRGFRFSTYAYRSIARNAYRTITSDQKEEARFCGDSTERTFEQEDTRSSSAADHIWSKLREMLGTMLEGLDRREQLIIRSRYALGSHRKARTFQSMADKLGISKERVRQLEQRAVGKLQAMAGQYDVDELFGASMA